MWNLFLEIDNFCKYHSLLNLYKKTKFPLGLHSVNIPLESFNACIPVPITSYSMLLHFLACSIVRTN